MAAAAPFSQLPVKKNIARLQNWSLVVAGLMAIMSLTGLIFTESIYLTQEEVNSYQTNDLINILIGLPSLLGAIWLARRGRWIGLLFWPGALLYVIYNYVALLVGVTFGWAVLAFAILVGLSAYLIFALFRSMEAVTAKAKLAGAVFERFVGGVLVLFGAGFFFLAMDVVTNSQTATRPDVGVSVADLVLSVFLFASGILFFLRKPGGYISGPGMLYVATILFIAVILFVVIQPLLTDVPFVLEDLIVLGTMGIICLIPFGLMTRGLLSRG